jgi:hypothetical protein
VVEYAEPQGYWKQGDERPTLASDDVAAMQAMARCVTARTWDRSIGAMPGGIHPAACGWCDYPIEEVLKACDWATWHSRYLTTEYAVWHGAEHSSYARSLRGNVYENPTWHAWFALPQAERSYAVAQAASRTA